MVFCSFPCPGRPVHCILCPTNPGQKPGQKSGHKSGQKIGQNSARGGFLLTGGASGTRTLPINVYEQGFTISDIGMGSAVSIVIVALLLIFMFVYFKLIGKRADEN